MPDGGVFEGLLGFGGTLEQLFLWGVLQQVLGAMFTPYLQALQNDVWSQHPVMPITPPDLADMVERGRIDWGPAITEAALSGLDEQRFRLLEANVGQPPGPEFVGSLARRGIVPWAGAPGSPSFEESVRTSRVMTWWTDVWRQGLENLPITAADYNNAFVRNQISQDDWLKGMAINGIDETSAWILFHTTGRPIAPGQAATLVRRGLLPIGDPNSPPDPNELSYVQAIKEGDIKDKWAQPLEGLIPNIPGVFEIRWAAQSGGLDAATATKYYKMQGLPGDIIQGMLAAASGRKLAGSKQLAISVTEQLYHDGLITRDEFATDIAVLGYDQQEADAILAVQDYKIIAETETAAMSKVRNAFLARHIEAAVAQTVLTEEGISQETATRLINLWTDERAATIRLLTPGEIVAAVYYGSRDVEWAMGHLETLGYNADDAWVLIANRLHSSTATEAAWEAEAITAAQTAAQAAAASSTPAGGSTSASPS